MPLQYDIFNFNSAFLLQSVYSGFPLHTQTTGKNYYSYPSFYSFNISVRPSAIIYSLQRPFAPQLHTAWIPPFYSTDTSFSRSCTTNKFDSFVCGLVWPFATFFTCILAYPPNLRALTNMPYSYTFAFADCIFICHNLLLQWIKLRRNSKPIPELGSECKRHFGVG